ncbi:hypothetical protein BGZ61DRAFT_518136 [Ilyonectria robusta]|uniref:uncharacterized protein n=1 Tax=Ilyonectria robusta TaxID=1079257 RepID=UPI001E8D5378|nr:uncharacterized protein BGZ61DRAFT_518136 [Ilyonectria robusta]KAH8694735.1 hypothetical protein BGZ61DRAFT_518136 [Ilyonectria robusta]
MDAAAQFKVVSQGDYARKIRASQHRPSHTKSTSGCLMCKAKKVKCDETKPICVRCQRNGRQCAYPQSGICKATPSYSTSMSRQNPGSALSVLSAVTIISFSSPSAKNGTPSVYLMQHLHQDWGQIFDIPCSPEILSLFKSHSLVRNTILAITACHLRHVSPGVIHHRVAEHFQQSLALHDYQATLDTPRQELGQSDVDVLLVSAVLLNILALTLPESETSEVSDSWVFSLRQDRLGWLALQAGLRPLIVSMWGQEEANLKRSLDFLSRVFLGVGNGDWAPVRPTHNLDGVPDTWIKVFGLDKGPDDENEENEDDIFRAPVTVLIWLRKLEPVRKNVLLNFTFLSKMNTKLRDMLFTRDERAMWLFGYWLGLMSGFKGVWWCDKRVERDYQAILIWLEHLRLDDRPGIEGKLWKELMMDIKLAPVFIQL